MLGEDFAGAVREGRRQEGTKGGVYHVCKGQREVTVLAMGDVERYWVSLVADISEFLAEHQHLGPGTARVGATPAPRVFTRPGDKLAQLEYYYWEEGMAVGATCGHRGCPRGN